MSAFERLLEDNPAMVEKPCGDAMAASLSGAFPCRAQRPSGIGHSLRTSAREVHHARLDQSIGRLCGVGRGGGDCVWDNSSLGLFDFIYPLQTLYNGVMRTT